MARNSEVDPNSVEASAANADANAEALEGQKKQQEAQAKVTERIEARGRKALGANEMLPGEPPEQYKLRMSVEAMETAASMHMDETVPGGLYKDQYGRFVDANGRVLDGVRGADDADHSGELRDAVKVS